MEELKYTSTKIFTRNKQGELIEKRVKAAQVCPGLLVTPDKFGMVDLIIEYNGIKWREGQTTLARADNVCKRMSGILKSIAEGKLTTLDDYHKEMHRRIFNPDAPAVMELKKPECKPKQPKMNMDGTIRAKVLQYKSDGNTLTEKWKTLTKFSEGIYYTKDTDAWNNTVYPFFFEDNGVFWYSQIAHSENQINRPEVKERLIDLRANFRAILKEKAANNAFINTLQIEVTRRLGEDVAPLLASREAYLKQREEEERQKAEEAERHEREAKAAEERHNTEELAKGKQNLMEHKAVTVEQIELLAESVGYKINIRTLGFMRENVTEAVLMEDGRVTVWGRNLTSRNIDGTAKVLAEIAERLKVQSEEEAQYSPQATETPQISTETAKVENVSAEDETTAGAVNMSYEDAAQMVTSELAKNKAMRTAWLLELSDGTQIRVRHNYTLPEPYGDQYIYEELSPKDGHVCFSVTCDEQRIINEITQHLTELPETPPAKELPTEKEKVAQTANKRQNPTIKKFLHVRKFRITEGLSFPRHWESGCRIGSVLSEVSTVFHGECSTRFVPQIFSGCTTALPP